MTTLYKTIQNKTSFGKRFDQDMNDTIVVKGLFKAPNNHDIVVGNVKLVYIKSYIEEKNYFCGCVAGSQLHEFFYNIYSINNKEMVFVYKKYLGNFFYHNDVNFQNTKRNEPYEFSHIEYNQKEYYEKDN